MNGIIYMRISPSGKRYIGQTTKTESERWKEHVDDAKRKTSNTPLNTAIRKYGADAFDVVILEDGIQTTELLNEREQYWIKEYHTLVAENKNGLNVTIGGFGHRIYDPEIFIRLYNNGYSIGEISKTTGAIPSTISKRIQQDKRINFSRARRATLKKNPPMPLSCYNIETCELKYSFLNVKEAVKFFDPDNNNCSAIYHVLNGRRRTAYGYLWKYDNQPISAIYEAREKYFRSKTCSKKGNSVINIDTGETFKSAHSAGIYYSIDCRKINACCSGEATSAGGYRWKYANKEISTTNIVDKRSKPVICIETNTIYPTIKNASLCTGIYINTLRSCLQGKIDSINGLHYKFYYEKDDCYGQ